MITKVLTEKTISYSLSLQDQAFRAQEHLSRRMDILVDFWSTHRVMLVEPGDPKTERVIADLKIMQMQLEGALSMVVTSTVMNRAIKEFLDTTLDG